ncbi:GNAT family N-acetyltransferase [Herbidospora mongoliensis]|uniref:GNAT family N-acetyltransferase n=1 Tax=Herbidospora mongoliensis TaxID=688067 RepID=UPI00082E6F91|nr:GNAT family N-acetyltransferase [Herbidospora mongoliensis]
MATEPEWWRLERSAARVWPAVHTEERDGWLLRHTPSVPRRRTNSALPLHGSSPSIEAVETYYRDLGQAVCIQVSPAEVHPELDETLAARGYRRDAPTLILTAPTSIFEADGSVDQIHDRARWPEVFATLDDRLTTVDVILRIPEPVAFFAATVNGDIAGMGVFAVDEGYAGVFCMVTHPAHRRRGIASAVLAAGAGWAGSQGARRLFLQVEEDNPGARALYARQGFTFSHAYHYRILATG